MESKIATPNDSYSKVNSIIEEDQKRLTDTYDIFKDESSLKGINKIINMI